MHRYVARLESGVAHPGKRNFKILFSFYLFLLIFTNFLNNFGRHHTSVAGRRQTDRETLLRFTNKKLLAFYFASELLDPSTLKRTQL